MCVVTLLNVLFDDGIVPDGWTDSTILPLFKKGPVNDPNNYGGISLCDRISKLYRSIMNNRLQELIEQE